MSLSSSSGYKTGEFLPETHDAGADANPATSGKSYTIGSGANALIHGRDDMGRPVVLLINACVYAGRKLVTVPVKNDGGEPYSEDVSGWRSVYLVLTHPESPTGKYKLSVSKTSEGTDGKKTSIQLYSLDPNTGVVLADYRGAPVVPVYE